MDKRRFSSRGYHITLLAFYYRRPCTIHGCWTTALELHYNIDHSSIAPVRLLRQRSSNPSRNYSTRAANGGVSAVLSNEVANQERIVSLLSRPATTTCLGISNSLSGRFHDDHDDPIMRAVKRKRSGAPRQTDLR